MAKPHRRPGIVLQSQSANSKVGIKATLKLIKALPGFKLDESVCCMEHTATADRGNIQCACFRSTLPSWASLVVGKQLTNQEGGRPPCGVVYNGVRMMLSMRSVLLNTPARAAPFRFRDKIRLWQPSRPILQKLAALSALRQRLIGVRRQLEQPLAEQQTFWKSSLHKQVSKTCQVALKGIRADLESIDKQIHALIEEDHRLKELFDWITSIPGIGHATATELLVATDEFTAINDAKKLACHAGVAPFDRVAGAISIGY